MVAINVRLVASHGLSLVVQCYNFAVQQFADDVYSVPGGFRASYLRSGVPRLLPLAYHDGLCA